MKELKKEFRWFNIMEYEKEENYLSKRHQEGWKFKRVTFPGVYTFERCEPEKVIYQLDYNKEGIKHQMEYVRMFEDCGWEYLTEFDGYNYFRKPADKMQQKEEIFCDDISRLDMMNRIFIGRVIPLVVILCGLIWQLYISATDHSERGWLPVFMVLVVIYIIIFFIGDYIRKGTGFQSWSGSPEPDRKKERNGGLCNRIVPLHRTSVSIKVR